MPSGSLAKPGLDFSRRFTGPDDDGSQGIGWTRRDVSIIGADGRPVFEATGIEVPEAWSPLATQIVASKYMRQAGVPQPDGGHGAETSVRQVVDRIVRTLEDAGRQHGYFAGQDAAEVFGAELRHLLLRQKAAFNSPVWFNLGLSEAYGVEGKNGHWAWDREAAQAVRVDDPYVRPQVSACFIQGVDDSLVGEDGIFDLVRKEAQLFKYGSGTGTNFSPLRSKYETLSGGGTSSGLLSFLRVFDAAAGATKSGGTTRRAAKMVCLDVDHPEIEDFIAWKVREEDKARALMGAGYDGTWDGEAYASISGQNANNSVRAPDAFMQAVDEDGTWSTRLRTTGKVHQEIPARRLWDQIVDAAWRCADPGLQFHDTINRWHTCKATGPINASNPCSEYMFLDDSACNLASLDLLAFWDPDHGFDVEGFQHAVRVVFTAQDILVSHAGYPTEAVTRNSERFRPLGLGYADLGALLMAHGLPYDSPEGRGLAAAITSLMTGTAYAVSAELAASLGPFDGIDEVADGITNREHMAQVMAMHQDAAARLGETGSPINGLESGVPENAGPIVQAAWDAWDTARAAADEAGWRNAQATVLAPTGTIGLLMDCDTTGIEPDFSLVKLKTLAGGGVTRIINRSVPRALRTLGYTDDEIRLVERHALGAGTFDGAPVDKQVMLDAGFTEEQYQEAYDHVAATGRFDDSTPAIGPASMREAGFSEQAIDALQHHVEGHQTVEGSLVKDEHLPVFDCANRCGEGTRSIAPMGHVRMMAAVQPFLSGAISKTVNLPHDATAEAVGEVYTEAWRLGLKAIAVYRDGCKASQPLATGRKRKAAAGQEATDGAAPGQETATPPADRRAAVPRGQTEDPPRDNDSGFKRTVTIFTQQGSVKVDIHVWEYPDGRPCEVFVGARRSGTMVDEFLKEIGRDYSRILQLGMDLDALTAKLMNQHGPLAGQTDHPYIKRVLGIQDLLGKLLRYEYFGETRFLSVQPDPDADDYVPPRRETLERIHQAIHRPRNEAKLEHFQDRPGEAVQPAGRGGPGGSPAMGAERPASMAPARDPEREWLEDLSGDAPPCDQCGHTTVQNGACYKCLNCGNSMGCS